MLPCLLIGLLSWPLLSSCQQLQLQQELYDVRPTGSVPPPRPAVSPGRVLPSVVAVDAAPLEHPPVVFEPFSTEDVPSQPHKRRRQFLRSEDTRSLTELRPATEGDPATPSALPVVSEFRTSREYERHQRRKGPGEQNTKRDDDLRLATPHPQSHDPSQSRAPLEEKPAHPLDAQVPGVPTQVQPVPLTRPYGSTGHSLLPQEHQVHPQAPRADPASARHPQAPRAGPASARQTEVAAEESGDEHYVRLYSDAWDLERPESGPRPTTTTPDDSLSALEFELAAYNVTLFDAAMDFMLRDSTNLTALFPNASSWRGDDVNMTRSIGVMNTLFAALQTGLDAEGPLFLGGLAGAQLRPVRRTRGRGGSSPYQRAPVMHQFRPSTDQRFLGSRAACDSCEFFMTCWMSGGTVRGGCGGFMFGCCERGTRSGKALNRRPPPANLDYGPVRNDAGCGLSDTSRIGITRRIVGGNQAGFGTFPWQAYILIGTSRCGGSLINQQHVLTAGHCVARARPGQITITLGDYVLNSNREPLPAYKFGVREINVHPSFKFTPQADRYDVAVLTLDRPVPHAPHIQPICLPEKGDEFEGYYGWAAGWGALRPGSRVRPKELQVVDVPVINRHMCEQWHRQKGINVVIHEEMMCAGYINGGKDSCQGDSGGPLMIENDGRWYLMGIVSAGYSCAKGKQPGIYHRVSMTSDWISYIAGN